MRYGSVCSGIEAATVAWEFIGWQCQFLSEIDKFPRAVLKHHYPELPLHGDFTTIGVDDYGTIDLLVGGTPCQSFSVAGLRGGMDDARGNLALEFLKLAQRLRPTWVVWENVPGVLSSNEGRDFGSILGGLVELGYGFAYRVLDAQYFGVPQRRRRVFVVGCLGDWRAAAAVLFERQSMCGYPAPSRSKGEDPAARVVGSLAESSGHARPGDNVQSSDYLIPDVANPLTHRMHKGVNSTMDEGQTVIMEHIDGGDTARTLTAEGHDAMPTADGLGYDVVAFNWQNGAGYGEANDGLGVTEEGTGPLQRSQTPAVAFQPRYARNDRGAPDEIAAPLTAQAGKDGRGDSAQCVAFDEQQITNNNNRANPKPGDPAPTMGARSRLRAASSLAVRRLTPVECERLQGFPDDWTQIPWRGKSAEECPDGPRYKALGNSMAVPVMRWIGERIQTMEMKR